MTSKAQLRSTNLEEGKRVEVEEDIIRGYGYQML